MRLREGTGNSNGRGVFGASGGSAHEVAPTSGGRETRLSDPAPALPPARWDGS